MAVAQHPPTLDPTAVSRWQHIAPSRSPWLHEEVARRMLDRLTWIKRQPVQWAHWGAVRGGQNAHHELNARYPRARSFVVEALARHAQYALAHLVKPWWSPSGWRRKGSVVSAPPAASCELVWANMQLHESAQPQALIEQWHRLLAVDGFLMFSCLGPDTAREVHDVYAAMGWPVAGASFTDMHDWGDMLVNSGFAEPVMDMERITLTYATPQRLVGELVELGRNLHPARFNALRGRGWRATLEQAFSLHGKRDASGQLVLTFEVIYGHALKAAPRIKMSSLSSVSVADMRSMLNTPYKRESSSSF